MSLYHIVFNTGEVFEGGDLKTTKWMEMPNKDIRTLFYYLPQGDVLCLSGYDAYYHSVEVTQDLMGKDKGITKIEYTYLMARIKNIVKVYKIGILKSTLEMFIYDVNDEFVKKWNKIGWHKGGK
jgi:hypothetical protein